MRLRVLGKYGLVVTTPARKKDHGLKWRVSIEGEKNVCNHTVVVIARVKLDDFMFADAFLCCSQRYGIERCMDYR